MGMRHILFLVIAVIGISAFCEELRGQSLYSYLDENGNRVFTNVPPVNPASDLTITGAPSPENQPATKPSKTNQYDSIIEKYAGDYRLDPHLIRSIIATESGFNPKAVSPKGARGLMQLMPATAARLGVQNSFDPEQNIHGGIKHFRSLMDNFNDVTLSLAAYNAGENRVQRLGRVPEIRETREYVQSVTKRWNASKEFTAPVQQEEDKPSPIFRFPDEDGVLHLTNIPPVR
jgi:soluble lytic murein transglycosylase-like protein